MLHESVSDTSPSAWPHASEEFGLREIAELSVVEAAGPDAVCPEARILADRWPGNGHKDSRSIAHKCVLFR